ncbi:MAG: VWA domain-containing protein [Bacteroidales bacterium]|nr:VWA domain-containing protein [Bacteroidales bacterium]
MFRFEYETVLYSLIIIPILIGLYIYLQYYRKKKMEAYGSSALTRRLSAEDSPAMHHVKFGLFLAGLTCLIFALANPQVGSSLEKGTRKGVDIMICMDISNSMLAEDIQPNRLEASKMALSRFIDKLQGDRIGLVVFAGKAFVQLPITSDYAAAKMFINIVKPSLISEQGTDIANALDLATVSMLPENDKVQQKQLSDLTSKVILVVSDGEDHFPESIEMAQEVHKLGITIHTIGIGNTLGEPIPLRDKYGNPTYKKDRDGNTVMTRLNEEVLQDIARAGGGTYVHASNANMGFETILNKINSMNKTDIQEVTFTRYDSKFQIPLMLSLLFFFIEILLFTTPSKIKQLLGKLQHQFKGKAALIGIALLMAMPAMQAQTKAELSAIRKGNEQFKTAEQFRKDAMELMSKGGEVNKRNADEKMKKAAENYQKAEINYRKAMEATPNYDKANYNLGNSLYRQERYEDAGKAFENVANNKSSSKDLRERAYHNLGNSLLKQEKYKESIDAYKNALKLNPKDMDSKYNLEYARKKMMQQMQQQQQNQQNQDQNQDQQQQQGGQGQKDQNKDQQDQNSGQGQQNQDKDKDQNKDKQNQQQQGQDQQDKKDQQQQQQQSAADRQKQQDNKRQLDALQQNERNTQQKVSKQQMQGGNKTHQEKDW